MSHLQDALRTFLLRKLDNLTKDDKCQITMISTWATELYLDKVLAPVLDTRLLIENCDTNSIRKLFPLNFGTLKIATSENSYVNTI